MIELTQSAREIAKEISEGKRAPQHIGEKTYEALRQELFSLKNSNHSDTMTDGEKKSFDEKLTTLIAEIQKLPEVNQNQLYDEVDAMLNP